MPWMDRLDWPRHTARLSLRPAGADDLTALWRIRTQPEVGRWMGDAAADHDAFLADALELRRLDVTLLVERDGRIIGDLMLRIEDAWGQREVKEQVVGVQAELGWCLDPAEQGHGYATEAIEELIRIAFTDLGLRRVTALCFADNEPSWRLMERVGMRREAYNVRDSLHRSGQWLDGMQYALLAEEWPG